MSNQHDYNGEYGSWAAIDKAPTALIDGGDPSSSTHVLYTHPRAESGGLRLQLALASIQNRSGSTSNVGIGVRIPTSLWKAGLWTNGTTTYTDDTTDFQDAGASDGALETTTNNDGFIVSSTKLFNALSIAVGTASTGSPVRVLEYSSGTSTWTAITNFVNFAGSSVNYATGENVIVWVPPANWAVRASGHGTGVTVGHYGIRVRATTAPTVAGLASTMSVHRLYFLLEGLGDGNVYEAPLNGAYFPMEPSGDALVSYISVLNNQNQVSALARVRG
jgi:hypothetical protein